MAVKPEKSNFPELPRTTEEELMTLGTFYSICLACGNGDLKKVQKLVKQFQAMSKACPHLFSSTDCLLDFRDYDQRTALHIASSAGHLDIVQFLIDELHVDVNPEDRFGGTPLADALREGHHELIHFFKERGGIINARLRRSCSTGTFTQRHSDEKDKEKLKNGKTSVLSSSDEEGESDSSEEQEDLAAEALVVAALFTAIIENNVEKVGDMLEAGVDPSIRDYDHRTAAHIAAAEGRLEILRLLHKYGADMNAEDRWERRPMNDAHHRGQKEIVKYLREIGSTANFKPIELVTELCTAAESGSLDDIKELLALGADPNLKNSDGRTALHLAAAEGHLKVVRYLLKHGASVKVADRWGATPLNDAVKSNHKKIIELMKKYGADTLFINEEREAATLCSAAARGDLALVKHLVENGTSVNSRDYDQRTPLHIAASEGFLDIVQYLISKDADMDATDKWGNTPLHNAGSRAHHEVYEYMVGEIGGEVGEEGGGGGESTSEAEHGGETSEGEQSSDKKRPRTPSRSSLIKVPSESKLDTSIIPKDTTEELEKLEIIALLSKMKTGMMFHSYILKCFEALESKLETEKVDHKQFERKNRRLEDLGVIIEALQTHFNKEAIQRVGAQVIIHLSKDSKLSRHLVKEDVVLVLFNIMRCKIFSIATKTKAMSALASLTHTSPGKARTLTRAITSEGGVRSILHLLKVNMDKDFAKFALAVLWNICNLDEKNTRRFELENGLPLVMQIWKEYQDDPKLAYIVTGALSALLVPPDQQLVFRDEVKGLELLLQTMDKYMDNPQVQENICCILVVLATAADDSFSHEPHFDLAEQFSALGGLPLIIRSMKTHKEVVTLQENAAATLYFLAQRSPKLRKPMLEAGALSAVEEAIKKNPQSYALRELKKKLRMYEKGCFLM
jgi:ankyrin repeat protein